MLAFHLFSDPEKAVNYKNNINSYTSAITHHFPDFFSLMKTILTPKD